MAEPTLDDTSQTAQSAAELRALIEARKAATVLWPKDEILKLMDERDAWQRCAATMATACMRGDAVSAFTIWAEHVAARAKQAVEGGE